MKLHIIKSRPQYYFTKLIFHIKNFPRNKSEISKRFALRKIAVFFFFFTLLKIGKFQKKGD